MFKEYENKSLTKGDIVTKRKKLKLNAPLKNYRIGDVIEIDVDNNSVPLSRYWRDRLKDAQFDNCVEFVKGAKR